MNTDDIMQLALEMGKIKTLHGDSGIFYKSNNINKAYVGIDISNDDLSYAKKEGFDLAISHHPPNKIFTLQFCEEINGMTNFLIKNGVPKENAKRAIKPIYERHFEWNKSNNHEQTKAFAKEIDMPLMNIHQPCDELGRAYLQNVIDSLTPSNKIQDLIIKFEEIPEMISGNEKVELVCGNLGNPIGKALMYHGFGTNGGFSGADALFDAGFDTIIYIHIHPFQKDERDQLNLQNKGNVIITGHYQSDWIGMNIFLKSLESYGISITRKN